MANINTYTHNLSVIISNNAQQPILARRRTSSLFLSASVDSMDNFRHNPILCLLRILLPSRK